VNTGDTCTDTPHTHRVDTPFARAYSRFARASAIAAALRTLAADSAATFGESHDLTRALGHAESLALDVVIAERAVCRNVKGAAA
jgi:hypothetical protein